MNRKQCSAISGRLFKKKTFTYISCKILVSKYLFPLYFVVCIGPHILAIIAFSSEFLIKIPFNGDFAWLAWTQVVQVLLCWLPISFIPQLTHPNHLFHNIQVPVSHSIVPEDVISTNFCWCPHCSRRLLQNEAGQGFYLWTIAKCNYFNTL